MIVDTSALVAIFADERERAAFLLAIASSGRCMTSAGSWVEFATVLVRKLGVADPAAVQRSFSASLRLMIVPTDATQAALASEGYARFGRGAPHGASLNFGDCFAYALAKATGEPLLFKGDDFNHTDLTLATESSYPH